MVEPPTNWKPQDDNTSTVSSTIGKFSGLNVDAAEFVPSSTSGFSAVAKIPVAQQQPKQPIATVGERESDDFPDAAIEQLVDGMTATTKTNITTHASTVPKEKKNTAVKCDIVRKKESVNILFCGHVDAGKSTIGGHLMYLTGRVEKRTLEKYQHEARERGRDSWYFAWLLDINEEERDKGKTVEVGRAWLETEKNHYIILDAPGHGCFVPNMIVGAAQADVAILVISARKGEFEAGFERNGQTNEHARLVRVAGVRYLVVLVNKMDDPTVNWDQRRYEEIRNKLTPFLATYDFKSGENTVFIPCSGMTGAFLKEPPDEEIVSWYKGPTFLEYLDSLPSLNQNIDGPFRMPIVERHKEMGVIVRGKIESGCCRVGDKCIIMPKGTRVEVTNIYYEEDETDSCVCGENVRLKLKNVEEEEISSGSILCDAQQEPCSVGRVFDAQVQIIEHESIISLGYSPVLHIHTAVVEVQLKKLIVLIDERTGERTQEYPRFIKQDQGAIARFELTKSGQAICMEPFKRFPQLSRFTLRDQGRTVAFGKVLKIIE